MSKFMMKLNDARAFIKAFDQNLMAASTKQFRSHVCYYCKAIIVSKGSTHFANCTTLTNTSAAVTATNAVHSFSYAHLTGDPTAAVCSVRFSEGTDSASAESSVKCDCGGAKTTGTHSEWCSTNRPTKESDFEDTSLENALNRV